MIASRLKPRHRSGILHEKLGCLDTSDRRLIFFVPQLALWRPTPPVLIASRDRQTSRLMISATE
jgi:hypothetical protein